MSKLDKKPMQHAQFSKSSHDLSHTFDFTSSTGMILPLEHDVLNPGESIECKIDLSNTRTMPLQAAAYLDLDMHVDYFFVPFTLLFSQFESFIYRINDYFSSAASVTGSLPLFGIGSAKQNALPIFGSPINSYIPHDFDEIGKGMLRLYEHLGYGTLEIDDGSYTYNPNVFPYAGLAYNAIYQYYFRNDEYEKFDNRFFNVDDPNIGGSIPNFIGSIPLFTLKYRDKYHDYFTSIKSSPIVSGKNLIDSAGALNLAKSWLSREQSFSVGSGPMNTLIDGRSGYPGPASSSPSYANDSQVRTNFGFQTQLGSDSLENLRANGFPNGVDINTANLRALFANEKLWTITGMNRKQYDAQTLAHFGYDVPTDVMHQVQHIGHHLYQIHVGEVISTAGTDEQPLATVAGKGYAFENNDKPIRFTAPCHGVFMAVYSSAIHRNYFNNFRKENAIATWQDFYQPEFDNLGMQPIFGFEVMQRVYGGSFIPQEPFGNIIGWQYRYEQFKRRYDRSTFAFASLWRSTGQTENLFFGPFGSWAPSDLALEGFAQSMAFNPSDALMWCLKESPTELNSLMVVGYDPDWYQSDVADALNYLKNPWQAYATDPLVHHGLIHYKKLSTMSAYSLPKLD